MGSVKFEKHLLATSIAMVLGAGTLMPATAMAEEAEANVERIEVRGMRASLTASMNEKRFNNAVVDAVTAEDIGKFPDNNIADSLSRIPGIAVSKQFGEGSTVSIRGASNQQTLTTLNGQSVASTGWYSQQAIDRSFNYSLLPSELVSSVQVYKSSQANLVEGGVGGTVQVNTRKPLELDANSVFGSIAGQYATGSEEFEPDLSGLYSWKNDAETFGILVGAAYQDYTLERRGQEALVSWGGRYADVNFHQERERRAYDVTLQYAPTSNLDMTLHYLNLELGANNINTASWVPQAGGIANDERCEVPSTSQTGSDLCLRKTTTAADGEQVFWDVRPRNGTMDSETLDFKLTYSGDAFTVSTQFGTTEASGGTSFETNYAAMLDPALSAGTIDATGDVAIIDTPGYGADAVPEEITGWLGLQGSQVVQQPNTDEETYAQVDFQFDVELGFITAIDVGVRYADHDVKTQQFRPIYKADADFHPTGSQMTDGTLEAGMDGKMIAAPDGSFMLSHTMAQIDGWTEDKTATATINEKNLAAYIMATYATERVRGNFGVRYIDTSAKGGYFQQSFVDGAIEFSDGLVYDKYDYSEWLPSVNLAFDLTDDMILRASAARVLTRPNYDDMFSNQRFVGQQDNTPGNEGLIQGTVRLDPYLANQADLGVEWYYTPSSLLAIGAFYKDVDNFTRIDRKLNQQIGVEAPDLVGVAPGDLPEGCVSADCWTVDSRVNGDGGDIKGVEFQWMHTFDSGFGGIFNYTYADASTDPLNFADRNGVFSDSSENYVNVVAFFENDTFSARAAYNWRSEYMVREVGFYGNRLHDDIGTLDLSFAYNFNEHLSFTLDAVNVTGEDDVELGNDNAALDGNSGAPRFTEGYPVATYERDTLYTVGVKVKF